MQSLLPFIISFCLVLGQLPAFEQTEQSHDHDLDFVHSALHKEGISHSHVEATEGDQSTILFGLSEEALEHCNPSIECNHSGILQLSSNTSAETPKTLYQQFNFHDWNAPFLDRSGPPPKA